MFTVTGSRNNSWLWTVLKCTIWTVTEMCRMYVWSHSSITDCAESITIIILIILMKKNKKKKKTQFIIDLKFKMNSSSKFCGPSIICRAAVSWRIRKSATGGGISFRRSGRICNLGERRFSGRRRLRITTIDATAVWPWANVMLLSRRGGTDRQAPARPPTAPCMGGLDDVAWQWSVLTGRRSIIQWHRPINGRSKDLDKRTGKAVGKSSLY